MKLRLGGLRLQLLALVILPFSVTLVALALFSVRVHQQAMRQLVAERDERATRAASAAIREQLHHRGSAVRGIALRLDNGTSATDVLGDSGFLSGDFDAGLAIVTLDGEVIASSIEDQDWLARPLAELLSRFPDDDSIFSSPFSEGDQLVLLVGASGGDQLAAVGAFTLGDLLYSATLTQAASQPQYIAILTDAEGRLLGHIGPLPSDLDLLHHPGVEAALRQEFGSSFLPAEDGEHVVAFSPVQPLGWALVIEEPWETVSSPLLDLTLLAPLTLAPALIVALVVLWFGARRVIAPLRQLEELAGQIALGDFDALEEQIPGIGEIRSLQRKIDWMARRLRDYRRALQSYIGSITEAQEEERGRLARELHDETIQELIAIDQRIQLAGMGIQHENPTLSDQLEDLHHQINDTVHGVRRLIHGLRPIFLEDLGLVSALQMLSKETESETTARVTFTLIGDPQRLDPPVEIAVYRIVQEALANVSRHAFADNVTVSMRFNPDELRLRVEDDGVGFRTPGDPSPLGTPGHLGLLGMRERAELIGANLNIRSSTGAGTRIELSLPLPTSGG